MSPKVFLIFACFANSGCMMFATAATISHLHKILPISAQVTPTAVASLKPGSIVQILCEGPNTQKEFKGTVLLASSNGVALMNCKITGRYEATPPAVLRLPYVNRLFKQSGIGRHQIPVQWVSIREMTSASEIVPPPPDYVAPQLDINTNDELYFERIGIDFDFNLVPDVSRQGGMVILNSTTAAPNVRSE